MASMLSRRIVLKQIPALAAATALSIKMSGITNVQAADLAIDELAKELAEQSQGQIVRPGNPGHDKIYPYNGRFDCIKTTAYLRPASVEGVQKIVAWANRRRRTLAIRGGGHSFEGKSNHSELVIDMSRLKKLNFNRDGTVSVEAGVQLGDVYKTLGAAGHVLPAGTCPTVGIVGHALGGGIGDFLPMFGYAAQSLQDVTLVTMAGTVLKVSDLGLDVLGGTPLPTADLRASDVMKVIRGGGQGSLGVVTNMTFRAYDVRQSKLASFRLESAGDVSPQRSIAIIQSWLTWREALPKQMHSLVSSKLDLSRSGSGCSFAIAGLIAIPAESSIRVADIRKTLDVLFQIPELRNKKYSPSLNATGAVKSFLDDDETTNNPKRKWLYGSSSALPAALPRRAVEYLVGNLKSRINASFYTSGGNSKAGPETSLHPSEFIVEWTTYSPRRDPGAHGRIRDLRGGVMKVAGFDDYAFPNYPDNEARDYFPNMLQIADLAKRLDPVGISTSSLLRESPQSGLDGKCL